MSRVLRLRWNGEQSLDSILDWITFCFSVLYFFCAKKRTKRQFDRRTTTWLSAAFGSHARRGSGSDDRKKITEKQVAYVICLERDFNCSTRAVYSSFSEYKEVFSYFVKQSEKRLKEFDFDFAALYLMSALLIIPDIQRKKLRGEIGPSQRIMASNKISSLIFLEKKQARKNKSAGFCVLELELEQWNLRLSLLLDAGSSD